MRAFVLPGCISHHQVLTLVRYDMGDANHLQYTSAPLSADLEVTGYPIARLWISCPGFDNVDVFVYLCLVEGVDDDAAGKYITEGCFRAEHRY